MAQSFSQAGSLTVRCAGSLRRLPVPRIRFIESDGRKVVVHMGREAISFYERMGDLEEALAGGFFRIHRGYLVNFSHVAGVRAGEVLLDSGEHLLLSKYKRSAFLAAYRDFLEGLAA